MKRRLAALILVVGAVALATALRQTPAQRAEAHALLVAADPPVNARLREPPTLLTLYFSEPIERRISGARVVDAAGKRVDQGFEFDDRDEALVRVRLGPVEPGYLTVFWETLSRVDGHRISGSYPLTVLNADGSLPAGQSAVAQAGGVAGGGAKPTAVIAKWALLAGGSLVMGAFLFFAWVIPAAGSVPGRQLLNGAAAALGGVGLALLVVGGVGQLLAQASDQGGLSQLGAVLTDTLWGERWIERNAILLPAAALLALAWRGDEAAGRRSAGGGISLLIVYFAVSASVSHAAAGRGSFWGTAADLVHLAAASAWAGMVLILGAAWMRTRSVPRRDRPALLASVLGRFSQAAVVAVALLLFTGGVNAVIEVRSVGDLVDTGYGRALLAKLLLLLPLLAVAGLNAYLFRPRLSAAAGRRRAAAAWDELERLLGRTVRLEGALLIGVLLAVAVLVQLVPTRAGLSAPVQASGKFVGQREVGDLGVTLVVDPNQPGNNTFEVYVTGAADTVERVRLYFESQRAGGAPASLLLDAANPPTFYVGEGPYLAQAGDWKVTVDLRRTTVDTAVPFQVRVPVPGGVVTAERGGAFDAPFPFGVGAALLFGASALAAAAVIAGSVARPGLPAGYLGDLAETLAASRRRPALALSALLVLGIGLGIALGSHAHGVLRKEEAARGNPVASTPASVERGRMLFFQSCTQCHGETGRGDGPLAASLTLKPANLFDHVPFHPDEFFFSVISNGLGGVMPGFGSSISEEDRWNIINFLRDQFGQRPAEQ